ncbi:glycosyltransferase family 4 protein [Candidatus Woesearchaeota archaeon]|nr:glycosyltransferase family 4 protein [Candidatus Woesearchaeota archaeon]
MARPRRLRILLIARNLSRYYGGGDYSVFKFCEALARQGHEIWIYSINRLPFMAGSEQWFRYQRYVGEIPRFFPGIWILNSVWEGLNDRLFDLRCRKEHFDCVIGYQRTSAVKAHRIATRINAVSVTFIFETPDWYAQLTGDTDERVQDEWVQFREVAKKSDILIANSRLTALNASKWLNRKVDAVILPGIDKVPDLPSVVERCQIIYIGRLYRTKNVDDLLKALSLIPKGKRPGVVIVGDGPERAVLQKLAEQLSIDSKFLGRISDEEKWRVISESMFLVFPTSFEGFGMPPMESLALGKPCIATDLPIFRSVYGNYIEYFKEHDLLGLAKKISMLMSDTQYRNRRGRAGKKFVMNTFSWDRSAKQLAALIAQRAF